LVAGVPRYHCDSVIEYAELCEMPYATKYYLQNACKCNQVLAATNRVICKWPEATNAIKSLQWVGKALSRSLGQREAVSFDEWGKHYSGRKKMRYLRAVQSLETRPIQRTDGYISAFVKLEKVEDPYKDPRMIQARGARYNVELGNYLKAFEHDFYHLRGEDVRTPFGQQCFPSGRLMVKGMDQVGRAALLTNKWNQFKEPVQLALDCSRFDGHCSVALLEQEHAMYLRLFNNDPYLMKLLSMQLKNVCYTQGGVKYSALGRRMSGDMNTAMGNCVIMLIMLATAMNELGVDLDQWTIADDGDDCCIIVEKRISDLVRKNLPEKFKMYGHELKIESEATILEHVTLCGCRPIRVGGRRVMILNPRRTVGKSRVHTRVYKTPFLEKYVSTTGQCLLALHAGVPVLQAHAMAFRRAHRETLKEIPGSYAYKFEHKMDEKDIFNVRPEPITDAAREDFAVAFGLPIEDQKQIELWYDNLSSSQLLRQAPPPEVPGRYYVYEEQ